MDQEHAFPAHPNPFSTLPRLLVAPQKRKLAAVYEKMDRTIPGFSGAVMLPTSMKHKKVTHIYKAIHRILSANPSLDLPLCTKGNFDQQQSSDTIY